MKARVIPMPKAPPRPTAKQLITRIRTMASEPIGDRMRIDHPHVQERMAERNINIRQVLETLRKGNSTRDPELDEWGDWRIKLRRRVAGRRVQVVVAVKTDHFVIVTVI